MTEEIPVFDGSRVCVGPYIVEVVPVSGELPPISVNVFDNIDGTLRKLPVVWAGAKHKKLRPIWRQGWAHRARQPSRGR